MRFVPAYSHNGPSEPGWSGVSGTVTGSGNPIDISGADPNNRPVLEIFCTGGTATVLIEANGGLLDATSTPPTGEWVDISDGGYALTAGTYVAKRIPVDLPYIRTRITVIGGATVTSYIPSLYFPSGQWGSATNPAKSSTGVA